MLCKFWCIPLPTFDIWFITRSTHRKERAQQQHRQLVLRQSPISAASLEHFQRRRCSKKRMTLCVGSEFEKFLKQSRFMEMRRLQVPGSGLRSILGAVASHNREPFIWNFQGRQLCTPRNSIFTLINLFPSKRLSNWHHPQPSERGSLIHFQFIFAKKARLEAEFFSFNLNYQQTSSAVHNF